MYCTNCGQKLLDGAGFCTKCGVPVSAGAADIRSVQTSMPHCPSRKSPSAMIPPLTLIGFFVGGMIGVASWQRSFEAVITGITGGSFEHSLLAFLTGGMLGALLGFFLGALLSTPKAGSSTKEEK